MSERIGRKTVLAALGIALLVSFLALGSSMQRGNRLSKELSKAKSEITDIGDELKETREMFELADTH